MYIDDKVKKVIVLLKDGIKELNRVRGYYEAEIDSPNNLPVFKKTSQQALTSFDGSKEKFIKLRFKNRPEEYQEYLKLSKFKGKNGDFTNNKIESEIDNMKYSIIYREKEKRFMGRFTIYGKRECAYGKTETECLKNCRKKKKEVLEKYQYDKVSNDAKLTLNHWFNYWMKNIKEPQVRESTSKQTLELYNRHVVNNIGKENIKKITAIKLQSFINKISSKDARRKIYKYLNEIFKLIHKMELIKNNPMAIVVNANREDETIIDEDINNYAEVLSYANEQKLFNRIKNAKCFYATKFILYTGLRRGECLGLMWKHVDLEKRTITIKQQFNKSIMKLTKTKTKSAERTIPMLPEAYEILLELSKNPHNADDLIFNEIDRLTNHLNQYSKDLGFKANPHLLRHTFASRCYFTGLDPKIIQEILGHKNMSTTLDTYTHVLDPNDKPIIDKMRKFFVSIKLIYE